MDKKNFVLYDAGGDVSKKWYIHFKNDGKRVFRYGDINRYKTEAERRAAADRLIGELQIEHFPPSATQSAVFAYLKSKEPRLRKKTYQSYHSKLSKFFECVNGSVNDEAFMAFFAHIKQHLQPKTCNEYFHTLSLLFAGIGIKVPKMEKMRVQSVPARYFTKLQRDFLGNEISERDPELWLFVQFVFYCFIRPGELRAVKVGDVLIEEAKILIRGEISKNKKEQYVVIPKAFLPQVEAAVMGRNPTDFIFGSGKKMLGIITMCRRHQKLLKELDFDTTKYKLYSWKHTGAVACAKQGIPIKQLQIQLRHHSLDQVNDYLRQMGADDCDAIANDFPMI